MNIVFRDGLLFTSVEISFRGVLKIIDDVVIDTGAAETIISPDIVEEMGIVAGPEDSINSFYGVGGSLHSFFSKNVDEFNFDGYKANNVKLDFGMIDPKGNINGLLGLDLLISMGVIIDLKNLTLRAG